ncbi:MAG: hypothetical protein A3E82_05435 [Gammaproteobacteria bacterium RIFCSPHIGHO2_12_FULL_38_11]|nr:MAG: hypothetical protein A3E82_05435 [Gammaproteobacteria bacterium RIFCSPHIGHO2_12_FULL_38_11]
MRYLQALRSKILSTTASDQVSAVAYHENSVLAQMNLGEIRAANLWKSNRKSSKENMDDMACIVYHDGLPTIIAADGAFGCEAQHIHFITTEIIPAILTTFISKLSIAKSEAEKKAVLESIFKAINKAVLQQYGLATASFVFSLAMIYQDKLTGEIKVAGFGTGDVTIVARKQTGEVDVLKPAQRIIDIHSAYLKFLAQFNDADIVPVPPPHQKQFLPLEPKDNIDEVVKQIHCFDRPIEEGIEIFCFSDGVLELLDCRIKKITVGNTVFLDVIPDVSVFSENTDVDRVVAICQNNRDKRFALMSAPVVDGELNLYQQQCQQAFGRFEPAVSSIGDDLIFVKTIVPSREQRATIEAASIISVPRTLAEFYVTYQADFNKKKGWFSRSGSFFGGEKSMQKQIEDCEVLSLDDITAHASTHPTSRTATIMKPSK